MDVFALARPHPWWWESDNHGYFENPVFPWTKADATPEEETGQPWEHWIPFPRKLVLVVDPPAPSEVPWPENLICKEDWG